MELPVSSLHLRKCWPECGQKDTRNLLHTSWVREPYMLDIIPGRKQRSRKYLDRLLDETSNISIWWNFFLVGCSYSGFAELRPTIRFFILIFTINLNLHSS